MYIVSLAHWQQQRIGSDLLGRAVAQAMTRCCCCSAPRMGARRHSTPTAIDHLSTMFPRRTGRVQTAWISKLNDLVPALISCLNFNKSAPATLQEQTFEMQVKSASADENDSCFARWLQERQRHRPFHSPSHYEGAASAFNFPSAPACC